MNSVQFDYARRQALREFTRGWLALRKADAGNREATEEALKHLYICLEWVTYESWQALWAEAQVALADAYLLRAVGEPLVNARMSALCYRQALNAYFDGAWDHASDTPGQPRNDAD